jgi:hypothetical protein
VVQYFELPRTNALYALMLLFSQLGRRWRLVARYTLLIVGSVARTWAFIHHTLVADWKSCELGGQCIVIGTKGNVTVTFASIWGVPRIEVQSRRHYFKVKVKGSRSRSSSRSSSRSRGQDLLRPWHTIDVVLHWCNGVGSTEKKFRHFQLNTFQIFFNVINVGVCHAQELLAVGSD